MAKPNSSGTPRTLEDWLIIGLGLSIVLAPWIVEETTNQMAVLNATLVGAAILMLAELDLVQLRRWTEVGLLVCGLWIAISAFVLGYGATGMLRVWHIVAGLLVATLAGLELRQHQNRSGR